MSGGGDYDDLLGRDALIGEAESLAEGVVSRHVDEGQPLDDRTQATLALTYAVLALVRTEGPDAPAAERAQQAGVRGWGAPRQHPVDWGSAGRGDA